MVGTRGAVDGRVGIDGVLVRVLQRGNYWDLHIVREKGFVYDLLSHMIKAVCDKPRNRFSENPDTLEWQFCLNPSLMASEPRKLTT